MKTMLDALDLNSVANEFFMCGSHGGCLGYMVPAYGWSHHWAGTLLYATSNQIIVHADFA